MTIQIGCPVQRNREFIIKDYLTCLSNLDYPKEDIHMAFLINGEQKDNTEEHIFNYMYENGEYCHFDIWVMDDNGDDTGRNNRDYRHFAEIRNSWLSMRRKTDTHILSIDSDILTSPNTVKQLLKTSTHGMSAAPVLNLDIPGRKVWNFLFDSGHLRDDGYKEYISGWRVPDREKKVDATGACVMIREEILNDGIDYGYHPQGEDLYFCEKAQDKGYKIYIDPKVQTEHIMVR
jgi:GT2 family glycosyltransferase